MTGRKIIQGLAIAVFVWFGAASARAIMRAIAGMIAVLVAGSAYAQQCPECTQAEACIAEYEAAVATMRSNARKHEADLQKQMQETNLGKPLTEFGMSRIREHMKLTAGFQIETLKECLGKIR